MSSKVYISGYGIVSALGVGLSENLQTLRACRSGIGIPQYLETRHQLPVGEVKISNKELLGLLRRNNKGMSRTALLGMLAAREAADMAGLSDAQLRECALINGTSVGGMDISELAYRDMQDGTEPEYETSFVGHDCGYSTERIAEYLQLHGYCQTVSTACSSSANTIMNAGRLIKAGHADCVIAGGTDSLSLFTLNGFNALKILDEHHCKPFDEHRKGLNLGEGAAFLVLESAESVRKRGAKVLAELTGYGNTNDAYHQTASSPEGKGAYSAMLKALKIAGLSPEKIDYVNVHGTGTANNDASESNALKKLFGDHVPPFSTTKAYTGHTLGAAGAIEAVFSLLSIEHSTIFPALNISEPLDIIKPPVTTLKSSEINTALSNSFGFGGNCTSLIFSKHL